MNGLVKIEGLIAAHALMVWTNFSANKIAP
jgi:hypothetical protein